MRRSDKQDVRQVRRCCDDERSAGIKADPPLYGCMYSAQRWTSFAGVAWGCATAELLWPKMQMANGDATTRPNAQQLVRVVIWPQGRIRISPRVSMPAMCHSCPLILAIALRRQLCRLPDCFPAITAWPRRNDLAMLDR